MKKCVIITSINQPGEVCEKFYKTGYDLIVVGDRKTPESYAAVTDLFFLDVAEQQARFGSFSDIAPFNHYARKNFGYLYAIEKGYDIIAESDDDNHPLPGWPRIEHRLHYDQVSGPRFPNIYKLFSDDLIWPRGFPLDRVGLDEAIEISSSVPSRVAVWQGLVNGDPDVDAIYRLTRSAMNQPFEFAGDHMLTLAEGIVSPFNTQNTIWIDKSCFAYLYLPSYVTFRVTDILKSFVAQFCCWARNRIIGFTGATAVQSRNPHDLMADFEQEIPLYTQFYKMIEALESVHYSGTNNDLMNAYEALEQRSIVDKQELPLVERWLDAVSTASTVAHDRIESSLR